MAKKTYGEELQAFEKYIKNAENEDAKRPLLFPIFKKLYGEKMKTESSACGADLYIDGLLLIECKTNYKQWLEGFYQALHYQRKYGLAYNTIMVIAKEFVGIWKLTKLPEYVTELSKKADPHVAPNAIGKINAKKTPIPVKKEIQTNANYWLTPKDLEGDIFAGAKNLLTESFEILKILKNIDSDRQQIGIHNFIHCIERMKPFFATPIEAVHAFYTIIYFWDITSKASTNETGTELRVLGYNGNKFSESVHLRPRQIDDFKRFIESQYVFTNEGSGLTVDYYFSRFDEVLATIDPEYVKQHGIFFTNNNLSKYALWFANHFFTENINEDYIVFDPAGGSGNLVSSWRGRLKHKIVSELQPDLLRTIERRMQADPFHTQSGFTIIPKTSDGVGLNFLDKSADEYLSILERELELRNISLNKPICFLLNPPYKNTDENETERDKTESKYEIHSTILEHTGDDAGKERYLGFLSQILNMSKRQYEKNSTKSVVMVFTPTSWLIPRPTYKSFRKIWDNHFKFHNGFIITSNEFFKLQGRWPLAFTIWSYDESDKQNEINVYDHTELKKATLNSIIWDNKDMQGEIDRLLKTMLSQSSVLNFKENKIDIRESLPLLERNGKMIPQGRVNLYRNRTKEEQGQKIISGFPLKDDRHFRVSAPHGFVDGTFIGFMDDITPVRLRQEPSGRFSNQPDRVWFYLDNRILKVNLLKCLNGAADNRSFCAYDLESAKHIFSWFCIGKSIANNYPVWANMFNLWQPNISKKAEPHWYALCFAFVLAENRCVVTKFEKDNPVIGAPEVFVDNPLCPTSLKGFWNLVLQPYLDSNTIDKNHPSILLIELIVELYKYWNHNYCKGQFLYNTGLHNEAYFKYFDYPDFLTPYSGLIQIKKYAEINMEVELLNRFSEISKLSKAVKQCIYDMLVIDFEYFK